MRDFRKMVVTSEGVSVSVVSRGSERGVAVVEAAGVDLEEGRGAGAAWVTWTV